MCTELEKWRLEERAEARAEGETEGKISVAKALLRKKISLDDIAEVTGLSLAKIEQLAVAER